MLLAACSSPVEEFPAAPTPASFPGDEIFAAAALGQPPARSTAPTEATTPSTAASSATTTPPTTTTATPVRVQADFAPRTYVPGECVTWPPAAAPARTAETVDCGEPHLLEIAGSVDLAQVFGTDRTAYPDDEDWAFVLERRCTALIERHLGRSLDPTGRLAPYGIKPSRPGWEQGDRILWCAVSSRDDRLDLPGDDTALQPFTGRAATIDQTLNFTPGTCLSADGATSRPAVVPCTDPHIYEVTGVVDLSARTSQPSSADAWAAIMDEECTRVTTGYLGRALANTERTFWVQIDDTAWEAGRRTTECLAAVVDGNERPLQLSRSLR